MLKTLIKSIFAVLVALPAMGQSLLEELPDDTEIILQDLGSSTPTPYQIEEVQPPMSDEADIAVLKGLDRLNDTVKEFQISVGETIRFERLEISLEQCRYPQGDIDRDAFALLTIRDVREMEPRFHGWMFASSPALSALDHHRYDVWVLSCQSS